MRKIRNKTCILKKENVPPNGRVLTWDEFTTAASFPTFLTLEEVGFDVLTGNENEIQVETTNQKMLEPFQLVEEQAPAASTNGQVEFFHHRLLLHQYNRLRGVFTNSEIIELISNLVQFSRY